MEKYFIDDGHEEPDIPDREPEKGMDEHKAMMTGIYRTLAELVEKSALSTAEKKKAALNLLKEYSEIFVDDLHIGGAANLPEEYHMEIKIAPGVETVLKDPPQVRQGAFMDPRWRETMTKLIKQRIIELRTGAVLYIHQAFFVNQKAGWRFVVNFKPGVNKHTTARIDGASN